MPIGLRGSIAVSALLAGLAPTLATAQSGQDWVRLRLGNMLRPDVTWPQVWPQMLGFYQASNPDERGVSAKGIDQLRRVAGAQRRGQTYGMLLAYDLDGDGQVTREELVAAFQPRARRAIQANGTQLEPTEGQVRQQLDRLVADALRPDVNRDGTIDAAEIRREAEARAEEATRAMDPGQYVSLSLDADGDGAVSRSEYEDAVRGEFARIDGDGDGRLSSAEIAGFQRVVAEARRADAEARQERSRRARLEAMVQSCQVEKPPAGARVVLLGGYEGRTLSNVSIGGDDREVSVANVEVAPGAEPLFLVGTSYDAMVWRVTGATERVAGFLAHSTAADGATGQPRVGVEGLPKDKVRFTQAARCLPYFTDRDYGSGVVALEFLFGKRPDETVGVYGIQTMRVPDARHEAETPASLASVALPDGGPAGAVWKQMLRFYSAGLANIDPSRVVAPLPVKRFEVLPQQAGLAQLVEEGALRVAGTSRTLRLGDGGLAPTAVEEVPHSFLIVRKMRYPAGLNGAHSVRFVLARDIPQPEGDPGHSCVIAEDDGKPIAGRPGCR